MRLRWDTIRLLVLDVDGVLTPPRLLLLGESGEAKQFSFRDGRAIKEFVATGRHVALLSSRDSVVTARRAAELGIETVMQGSGDKGADLQRLMKDFGVSAEQVCYVGDDHVDLPAMAIAGLSVAVGDAAPMVRLRAHYVAASAGGEGAVGEVIERIMHASRE